MTGTALSFFLLISLSVVLREVSACRMCHANTHAGRRRSLATQIKTTATTTVIIFLIIIHFFN
jgi:hypothetical protein